MCPRLVDCQNPAALEVLQHKKNNADVSLQERMGGNVYLVWFAAVAAAAAKIEEKKVAKRISLFFFISFSCDWSRDSQ